MGRKQCSGILRVLVDVDPSIKKGRKKQNKVFMDCSHITLTGFLCGHTNKQYEISNLDTCKSVESEIRRNGIPTHIRAMSPYDHMKARLPHLEFISGNMSQTNHSIPV